MNFKELIVPLTIALLGTWAIQYFFFTKKTSNPGTHALESFVAPAGAQAAKPLQTEIDFVDAKREQAAHITELQTDHAILVFSTDGASLERLEFKRDSGQKKFSIDTIFPVGDTEKEKRCFLVACDQKTPFFYTLLDKNDLQDTSTLTYRVETDEMTLTKIFTVYKRSYQIDLELKISPKKADVSPGNLRVLYPSPLMPELHSVKSTLTGSSENADTISTIIADAQGPIQTISRAHINTGQGWFNPALFGTQSRYFVHAMVKDHHNFCQRAYYKLYDKNSMASILEGPVVHGDSSWRLTFYCGPKELSALVAADPRLESLDFSGILGPIAKWFLALLRWLYSWLHNYGLAIIALALMIRLLLLPFTFRAEQDNKKRLELQKKLAYIKQRYKDDPERLKQEQALLLTKHGLPGLAGCLPLLLQLPIFYALSRVLSGSIDLYKASFLWIPDLAAKDPWYIIPILTTISMILAMRSTGDTRQQLTSIAVAIFVGAISTSLSAGLALYILTSTFLGVVQTMAQKRFA